jgi:hypothetical protein
MNTPATYEDANLILRLYELRRDPKMREARAWFTKTFHPSTLEEYNQVAPFGSNESAYARQVITYWEMVASLIASGVLNEHLFFQSGMELLFVWERVKVMLPEMRTAYKNPALWKNLESIAERYAAHLGQEAYEAFAARVNPPAR